MVEFGIYEEGDYKRYIARKRTREYQTWINLLKRVFSLEYKSKYPTYSNCTISEEFRNFQKFAAWCNSQPGFHLNWTLDKDILVKGNKHYSRDFCTFVPQELNKLIEKSDAIRGEFPLGVSRDSRNPLKFCAFMKKNGKTINLGTYSDPSTAFETYKEAKEAHIKDVARQWKKVIEDRVYVALINYKIEIND